MSGQARILLLCDDRRGHANTVLDHIDAFTRFSRHHVRTFNPKSLKRSAALDLDEFDVIVIHYSVVLSNPMYVSPNLLDKLRRFRGLKVLFIQDDYRWVNRATAAARDVGINVLFTVAPEPAAGQLYDERLPDTRRVHTLTGYVPENLREMPLRPLRQRTIDVSYRARDLPFWLGQLSREKALIGQRFLELAPPYDLRCDIAWSEHERIYGGQWIEFVSSSRATLGTESGASIADFDGAAEMAVRAYLRTHPAAPFEEVQEAVLRPYEGNVVVKVISPRVFEATSLGTALVMFPGQYSGIVSRGEHYIALEKDFSNMDEVVAQLQDDDLVDAMTARAHDELIKSGRWSYASFIADFDRVVDEEAHVRRGRSSSELRYRLAKVERTLLVPGISVRLFRGAHAAWSQIFRRDPSMRFTIEYESQIEKGFLALRVVVGDRELRPLLRLGRRAGSPIDRLLREILELSLLRKAVAGRLVPDQDFTLNTEYDGARKSVCFVSVPIGSGSPERDSTSDLIRDLRAGELKIIEWDHRAMGGVIRLDRPAMEVGIGYKGLESFTALAAIGRRDPSALERALRPVLSTIKPVPTAVD